MKIKEINQQEYNLRILILMKLFSSDINKCKEFYQIYQKYKKINFYFLVSLIFQESRFNPRAISTANARGLGQIMFETAKFYGVKHRWQLFDWKLNLHVTLKHLIYLKDKWKDYDLVMIGYNAGESRILRYRKFGFKILPTETKLYVVKINKLWRHFRSIA